jgi:hypothetical protein
VKYDIHEVCGDRIRITTSDERWYARKVSADGTEENTRWEYYPSVTWIVNSGYPKGPELMRWVAKHGWDEAEEIKAAAGDSGSKEHQAVAVLLNGGTVDFTTEFENPRTLQRESLTADEYGRVMSFAEWCEEEEPHVLSSEMTVWNERYRYAGTLDILCRLKSTNYEFNHIVDVKRSSYVWPTMELQVSAYAHADGIPRDERGRLPRLGILQIGYNKNKKKKFKYTAVRSRFDLFLSARRIWANEMSGVSPLQRDYPKSISISVGKAVTA